MSLSVNKLPWWGQLVVVAVLVCGGIGAFWNFYASPAQAAIDAEQAKLDKLQDEIAKGKVTARRLPQFRTEVAGLEAQLERLRAVLPEEKDVADLLRRIQAMATESNLTIRGFTPQAVATKDMYAEWPIGLKVEGTYHNLGGFLERVSKFPRIINVGDIHIKAQDAKTATSTISAECTATTFVLIDAKPAAPAATPAGAARTE